VEAVSDRRSEAGFTLVELAVATAVLLFAVLLACDLLDESGRLLHHSVRRARDPWTVLAAELLRNDLRSADPTKIVPLAPPPMFEENRELQLRTADGVVVWDRTAAGELVRSIAAGPAHAYLRDVRSFRWRRLKGGGVEVWIRHHVSSPYLRQLAGSLPRSDPGEDLDLHVITVARGETMGEW
jgi:Prokaryotic N-terminal methylation motif